MTRDDKIFEMLENITAGQVELGRRMDKFDKEQEHIKIIFDGMRSKVGMLETDLFKLRHEVKESHAKLEADIVEMKADMVEVRTEIRETKDMFVLMEHRHKELITAAHDKIQLTYDICVELRDELKKVDKHQRTQDDYIFALKHKA